MAMFCTKCGAALTPGTRFCTTCGAPVEEPVTAPETPVVEEVPAAPVAPTPVEPTPVPVQPAPAPVQPAPAPVQPVVAPVQYVPVQPVQQMTAAPKKEVAGVGRYFWTMLLFTIPVVGFIFSIIFSFAPRNKSFKNFSRAMMIWYIIAIVIAIAIIVLLSVLGKSIGSALEINW